MRASSVIIVCSGRANDATAELLDETIEAAIQAKKEPILVLGPDGDEFLRTSKRIDDCEIVFDPNYDGGLFSSIKAGLHITKNAALVVPLHKSGLNPSLWQKLEQELIPKENHQECDVIRPMTHTDESALETLPHLVTQRGVRKLKSLAANTDWATSKGFSTRVVEV